MTHGDDDDRDLRERFSALRREESGGTPDFASVWEAARRRGAARAVWSPARMAAVAGIAALLVLLLVRPQATSRAPDRLPSAPSITEWRAATDFLLDVPGREVLGAMPSLGRRLPDYSALPGIGPTSHERRTSS